MQQLHSFKHLKKQFDYALNPICLIERQEILFKTLTYVLRLNCLLRDEESFTEIFRQKFIKTNNFRKFLAHITILVNNLVRVKIVNIGNFKSNLHISIIYALVKENYTISTLIYLWLIDKFYVFMMKVRLVRLWLFILYWI